VPLPLPPPADPRSVDPRRARYGSGPLWKLDKIVAVNSLPRGTIRPAPPNALHVTFPGQQGAGQPVRYFWCDTAIRHRYEIARNSVLFASTFETLASDGVARCAPRPCPIVQRHRVWFAEDLNSPRYPVSQPVSRPSTIVLPPPLRHASSTPARCVFLRRKNV